MPLRYPSDCSGLRYRCHSCSSSSDSRYRWACPWPRSLAITCLAVPVDFSPQLAIIKDGRVPPRVRRWLSIESGYNDGLVSPLLLAAVARATTSGDTGDQAVTALVKAAPAGAIAIVVGACVGTATGWIYRTAARAQWCDLRSIRIGVLALPVLTFAIATSVHGNGFVAAFVCGVAFRTSLSAHTDRAPDAPRAEFSLADDVAGVVNLQLWLAGTRASPPSSQPSSVTGHPWAIAGWCTNTCAARPNQQRRR